MNILTQSVLKIITCATCQCRSAFVFQRKLMESKEEEEKKQRDRTLKQNQKCKEEQEEEGYPPRKALWYCWSQEKVQHTLSNMYKDFGLILGLMRGAVWWCTMRANVSFWPQNSCIYISSTAIIVQLLLLILLLLCYFQRSGDAAVKQKMYCV